MVARGSLQTYDLLFHLRALRDAKHTGFLEVEKGKALLRFYLLEGEVISVQAKDVRQSFAAFLAKNKTLSKETLKEAHEEAESRGGSVPQILLEKNRISRDDLAASLTTYGHYLLAHGFSMAGASYRVQHCAAPSKPLHGLDISVEGGFFRYLAAIKDISDASKSIQSSFGDTIRTTPLFARMKPFLLGAFESKHDDSIVEEIEVGQVSISGLLEIGHNPNDIIRRVFAMVLTGMAYFEDDESGGDAWESIAADLAGLSGSQTTSPDDDFFGQSHQPEETPFDIAEEDETNESEAEPSRDSLKLEEEPEEELPEDDEPTEEDDETTEEDDETREEEPAPAVEASAKLDVFEDLFGDSPALQPQGSSTPPAPKAVPTAPKDAPAPPKKAATTSDSIQEDAFAILWAGRSDETREIIDALETTRPDPSTAGITRAILKDLKTMYDESIYHTLTLTPDAPISDIEQRCRVLRRKYNPASYADFMLPPEAESAIQQIAKRLRLAYLVLMNPEKRQAFHRYGRISSDTLRTSLADLAESAELQRRSALALEQKKYEAARGLLEKALEKVTHDATLHARYAWACLQGVRAGAFKKEDMEGLVSHHLGQAQSLNPEAEEVLRTVGRIARGDRRETEMLHAYEKLLKLYPGDEEAMNVLKSMTTGDEDWEDKKESGGFFSRIMGKGKKKK